MQRKNENIPPSENGIGGVGAGTKVTKDFFLPLTTSSFAYNLSHLPFFLLRKRDLFLPITLHRKFNNYTGCKFQSKGTSLLNTLASK